MTYLQEKANTFKRIKLEVGYRVTHLLTVDTDNLKYMELKSWIGRIHNKVKKEKHRRKEAWQKQSVQSRFHMLIRAGKRGDINNKKHKLALGWYFTLPQIIDPKTVRLGNTEKIEMLESFI